MLFHEFENPLVSTLSSGALVEWEAKWKKRGERLVQTRRLDSILAEHVPPNTDIDLVSIDVEGHDLNVLKSVNLNRYRHKRPPAGTPLQRAISTRSAERRAPDRGPET